MTSKIEHLPGKGLSKNRRVERLRRQIATLEQMDGAVWRKAIACALGLIVAFASSLFGILVYTGQPVAVPTAVLSIVSGFALFFLLRYWTLVMWLALVVTVLALAAAIFEGDVPELPDSTGVGNDTDSPAQHRSSSGGLSLDGLDISGEGKNKNRKRIAHAIARRRARLEMLLQRENSSA